MQELRDFFNAGSFQDMLAALNPSLDDAGVRDCCWLVPCSMAISAQSCWAPGCQAHAADREQLTLRGPVSDLRQHMAYMCMLTVRGVAAGHQAISQFLADKGKADAQGSSSSPEAAQALMGALHSLTGLRALLAAGLSSGELLACTAFAINGWHVQCGLARLPCVLLTARLS